MVAIANPVGGMILEIHRGISKQVVYAQQRQSTFIGGAESIPPVLETIMQSIRQDMLGMGKGRVVAISG